MRIKRCGHCRMMIVYGPVSVDVGCGVVATDEAFGLIEPQPALILRHLLLAQRPVGPDELADMLYGDREDGGALFVDELVRCQISKLRRTLRNMGGARIETTRETGRARYELRAA